MEYSTINEILNHTFTSIEGKAGDDEMIFHRDDGKKIRFYHDQDCCESVSIEDICGDTSDLVGTPIKMAEVAYKDDPNSLEGVGEWTFYKFASIMGYITVRWYGSSNGYYSISVNMIVE